MSFYRVCHSDQINLRCHELFLDRDGLEDPDAEIGVMWRDRIGTLPDYTPCTIVRLVWRDKQYVATMSEDMLVYGFTFVYNLRLCSG